MISNFVFFSYENHTIRAENCQCGQLLVEEDCMRTISLALMVPHLIEQLMSPGNTTWHMGYVTWALN